MGRKIFVGGLPKTVTLAEFTEHFSQYGETDEIKLIKSLEDPNFNRGYGFIQYKEQAVADNVVAETHTFQEKTVDVKINEVKPKSYFLAGLTDQITETDLREHFSQYGEISKVLVKSAKKIAFVDVKPNSEDVDILAATHEIKGTTLHISNARPKQNRGWGGGWGGRGGGWGGGYGGYGGGWGGQGGWGGFRGRGRGRGRGKIQTVQPAYGFGYGGGPYAPY